MSLRLLTTSGDANDSCSNSDKENEEDTKQPTSTAKDVTLSGQASQAIKIMRTPDLSKIRTSSGLSLTSRILLDKQPSAIERYHHEAIFTGENDRVYFEETSSIPDGRRHIVFVELKLTRISQIDTSNETFRCRFLMWLTWLASKEDVESFNLNKSSWKPTWTPKLYLINSNDSLSDSKISRVEDVPFTIIDGKHIADGRTKLPKDWKKNTKHFGFDPMNGYYVYSMWQCDYTFCEEMELASFPFDCQDLSIRIQSTLGIEQCDLVPMPRIHLCDDDSKNSQNHDQNIIPAIEFSSKDSVVDEWQFANVLCAFRYSNKIHSRSKKIYPKIIIQVKALRTWQAYIGLLMVSFLLFWMGLGTFAMSIEDAGDRLGYSITLLLAEVVNIQWAFDSLPNIPYLSLIEKYIFASFLYLFVISAYSILICYVVLYVDGDTIDTLQDFDFWVSIIFLILNFLVQFAFYKLAKQSREKEIEHLMLQQVDNERSLSDTYDENSRKDKIISLPIKFCHSDIQIAAKHGNKKRSGFALSSQTAAEIRKQVLERSKAFSIF